MDNQKATRGQLQVTNTAWAITKIVITRADQARTLFLENLLVKNPAKNTIRM